MARYIALRLASAVPVLLGVTLVVFLIMKLVPGDPIDIMFYGMPTPSPAVRANLERELGLDRSPPMQYVHFVTQAVQGDLGRSIRTQRPVTGEIASRLPNTILLTLTSLALSTVIGTAAGVLSATRRGSWLDSSAMFLSVGGLAIPSFWLGLMLIMLFSMRLGWLPATGSGSIEHMILPSLTLAALGIAIIARMTRSAMLEVLSQQYVATARAKGLADSQVVYGHALRNALIPIITIVGLQAGALLSGAFIVENVFAYPGMGQLAIQAVQTRDIPLVQGTVLVSAVIYLAVNLAADVTYAVVDPRIHY